MDTGKLERLNAFINNSSTVTELAGADINEPTHKAVKYDGDGNVILAANGAEAIGLILSDAPAPLKTGQRVSILIKNIGLLEAGEQISKGDFVTINSNGQGVKAANGDFIFGRAFTNASAGYCAQVQINHMGYMPQ